MPGTDHDLGHPRDGHRLTTTAPPAAGGLPHAFNLRGGGSRIEATHHIDQARPVRLRRRSTAHASRLLIRARFGRRSPSGASAPTAVTASDLPIKANLLRVTRISPVDDRPWHAGPVAATELVGLVRQVITACFLVTA